jgi:PAS domain S-box-containing protein
MFGARHLPPMAASKDPGTVDRQTEVETLRRSQQLWDGNRIDREEFFRTVLESLAEGLLITDDQSRILYSNSQLADLTGYSKDELLGRTSFEVLLEPGEWPSQKRRLKERLAGKSEVYEHQIIRKDGERHWVRVCATPYLDAQGKIIGTIGSVSCIERTKSLEIQNEVLRDEVQSQSNFRHIIGQSPALQKVLEQIKVVAPTQASVLVLGESGTGKELIARAIHDLSDRKGKPLVRVNCASVPKELFESEFFGHVKGAFTGAIKDRIGRFELANGGTLFLDEVGEIPLDLQAKLLRVLQEGQFEKLGEDRTRTVNVRVITATNRDLLEESRAGRFRQDLYFRLSVFPIEVPPLRERPEDIPLLAQFFVRQAAERLHTSLPRLSRDHVRQLEAYDWPGNVRELQNVIERATILFASKGRLEFALNREGARRPHTKPARTEVEEVHDRALPNLKSQEKQIILRALEKTGWKIYGDDGAAALLGMKPTTLSSRIHRHGLKRNR